MSVNVELKSDLDLCDYDNFLKQNYESTFYHYSKHLSFLTKILGIKPNFISVIKNKQIVGVMPFFIKKSKYGNVVNSLPFFGSYGGGITNDNLILEKMLKELNQFNLKNDVLSSVIAVSPFSKNNQIYEKFFHFQIKEQRLAQVIPLENKSEEIVWNDFEQRVRRAIRKSLKNEISIEFPKIDDTILQRFYQMHKLDIESKGGRAKPFKFFKYLQESFEQGSDYDIFCAKKNNEDIAYLLVFYFNSYAEYYMPAYDSDLKHLQGTSALIWRSLKTSIQKNIKFFNFGGTWHNQRELYMFKRGWNTLDYHYYYYIYGDLNKAREIGIENIKKHYPSFYVFPFEKLTST